MATELAGLALLSVAKPGTELAFAAALPDDNLLDGDGGDRRPRARNRDYAQRTICTADALTALWTVVQHFADVKGVIISPFFDDIYATFSDWRFSVWWHNASYITCGCWSPSRQSSMLTAKHDGTVDLWDLFVQKQRLRLRHIQATLEAETKQKAVEQKELRSADVQPHNATIATQRTTW